MIVYVYVWQDSEHSVEYLFSVGKNVITLKLKKKIGKENVT